MKRAIVSLALACAAVCAVVVGLRADDDKEKALAAKLVGTWRPISMKFGGQESDLPKTSQTYKHVTPAGIERWCVARSNRRRSDCPRLTCWYTSVVPSMPPL